MDIVGSKHTDATAYNAPHFEGRALRNLNIAVGGVFRLKPATHAAAPVAFDREFTIDQGKYDAAVNCGARPIDNRDVAWEDSDAYHAFASDPYREGRGRILDDEFIEVQRGVEIIVGG